MKNAWKWLMNQSLSKKMVIIIYSTIFLLSLVLIAVLMAIAEKNARDELYKTSIDELQSGSSMVEKEQQYLYGIADYYALSVEVQQMLRASNIGEQAAASDQLVQVAQARMYVLGICFYNLQGEAVSYSFIDRSHTPVAQHLPDQERPFDRLVRGEGTYEWEFIGKGWTQIMEKDNSPKLCLWRIVKDTRTLQPIGVVAVAIDSRRLLSSERIFAGLYNKIVLLNEDGAEAFNRTGLQLTQEDRATLMAGARESGGAFELKLEGKLYNVFYREVKGAPLVSFLIKPYQHFIWNLQTLVVYVLAVLSLYIVLLLPLLILLSHMLTKPLAHLRSSMEQFAAGNFEAHVRFKYEDEIGKAGQLFNRMVQDNRRLIDQTYVLQIKKQEAELSALQAQINPHFLYNLINLIQWNALRKGEEEIAEIAYAMGQLFRLSLAQGKPMIHLWQERDLIGHYLSLQQRCYGDCLTFDIDIADAISELYIPKLIIQPLVENAVEHGSDDHQRPVHISVRVRLESERLLIEVEDDGAGIPADILIQLPDKLPAQESRRRNRYAMKNISERLRLTYGDDYRFSIDSGFGRAGTHITIDIPALSDPV